MDAEDRDEEGFGKIEWMGVQKKVRSLGTLKRRVGRRKKGFGLIWISKESC